MAVKKYLALIAWFLSSLAVVVAILAWGQSVHWHFSDLSSYKIFPLFGLLAFSLIWSVYVIAFTQRRLKVDSKNLKQYYKILPLLILVLILIHPGLLVWQLWRDGFGLPPTSYLQHYVAPAARWAVLVSSTAWLVFLAYEFRYKFRNRPWWKYLEYASDTAFVGIFFHALKLGNNLQHGWFRYVWFFYGATLAVVLFDIYWRKIQKTILKYLTS